MHTHPRMHTCMPMVYVGLGALMLFGSYFQGVGLIFPSRLYMHLVITGAEEYQASRKVIRWMNPCS